MGFRAFVVLLVGCCRFVLDSARLYNGFGSFTGAYGVLWVHAFVRCGFVGVSAVLGVFGCVLGIRVSWGGGGGGSGVFRATESVETLRVWAAGVFGSRLSGSGPDALVSDPKILRKPKPAHGREKQGWRDGGGKRFWWSRRRRRNGWGVLSSKELVRVSPCGKKLGTGTISHMTAMSIAAVHVVPAPRRATTTITTTDNINN